MRYGKIYALLLAAMLTAGSFTTATAQPKIKGNVYGGGNAADVLTNTEVNITGGQIGITADADHGNVFGGGKGQNTTVKGDVSVNIGKAPEGSVTTYTGTGIVKGSVYGGSALGYVNANTTKGTDGTVTAHTANTDKTTQVNVFKGTVKENVYGGGRGDADNSIAAMSASAVTVTIGANATEATPTIDGSVYGGSDANGILESDVTLHILNGTIGKAGDGTSFTGGNVYGGGLGLPTLVQGSVTVNIGAAGTTPTGTANILGDVYGGSAKGKVNATKGGTAENPTYSNPNSKTTQVNLHSNTGVRNVYGGGHGLDGASADVYGDVEVNIGATDGASTPTYTGNATINGSVYGCNNAKGSPQGNVTVNVYKTAQTAKEVAAYTSSDATYAIDQVFGGGNEASYTPLETTNKAQVHIFTCLNTVKTVYGGGNAANATDVEVTIDGGRFERVFGGGNGEDSNKPAANISGSANTQVHGGRYDQVFGGSNSRGDVNSASLTLDNTSSCGDLVINNSFGGANEAEISGDIETTLRCSSDPNSTFSIGSFYGGSNKADIDGSVTLNVYGGAYINVFGGSKGDLASLGTEHITKAANISGDVTLNLYGGTITNAFGGSDVNGNITGKITVNVLDYQSNTCPLSITNIYGAGNLTTYTPDKVSDEVISSPEVNVIHMKEGSSITGNVYGGGKGDADHNALVTANPIVNIGYDAGNTSMSSLVTSAYLTATGLTVDDFMATVSGNVYGGGDLAGVTGNTTVYLRKANTSVGGSLFGGGNEAVVSGNTAVNVVNGTVTQDVYGGGALANVGTDASNTTQVTITDGTITGDVYGGGLGQLSKAAVLYTAEDAEVIAGTKQVGDVKEGAKEAIAALVNGAVTVNVNGGSVDEVFGCNNLNGAPQSTVEVNITNGNITNVFGGGNQAAYTGVPDVNISGGTITKVFGGGNEAGTGGSDVAITAGTISGGVYGGCNTSGTITGNTTVTLTGGTIGAEDAPAEVCGGGLGKDTKVTNSPTLCTSYVYVGTATDVADANTYTGSTTLYGDIYGGSAYGEVDNTEVNLFKLDGTSFGYNVFGGGKGKADDTGNIEAKVKGTATVNMYALTITGTDEAAAVYGGCNVNGTATAAIVNLIGGTIGTAPASGTSRLVNKVFGGGKGNSTTTTTATVNVGTDASTGSSNIYSNVYGGSALGAVGTTNVNLNKVAALTGDVFGGGMGRYTEGAADNAQATVTVTATVNLNDGFDLAGNIYGGCNIYGETANAEVNLIGGTVGTETANSQVYGGGKGAKTTFTTYNSETGKGTIAVNLGSKSTDATPVYGGTSHVYGKIYGGSENGSVQNVDVNLYGGIVTGDVFGGGYDTTDPTTVAAAKDVKVTLDGAYVSGSIFGCNDTNGSPSGTVEVHIYKTVHLVNGVVKDVDPGPTEYELQAVYGGGNEASTSGGTKVVINTCDPSIRTVYGGGNAADVGSTDVTVNGAHEIGTLFGGGNGSDTSKPGANVNGQARATLHGGKIHVVYGGSNENGDVIGGTYVDISDAGSTCTLDIGEVYGAGNNAGMQGGANIIMGCQPDNPIEDVYAGAKNADVGGNVSLTITSGKFGRVFGGNKFGGLLKGSITLNIEESGESCGTPIVIGELYSGGNLADYSVYGYDTSGKAIETGTSKTYSDPQLNIRSFTSIGAVYGGGFRALMVADPTVNINVVKGSHYNDNDLSASSFTGIKIHKKNTDGTIVEDETVSLSYPAHVKGAIGAIGNVFGGGNEAKLVGSATVNIGTETSIGLIKEPTHLIPSGSTSYPKNAETGKYDVAVEGANITGNVYGGGNQADVTGNTQVNICAKEIGTGDNKTWTSVTPGTAGVTIGENVFGGGKGIASDVTKAHVPATNIHIGNGAIKKSVYGGGELAQVEGNTNVTVMGGTIGTEQSGTTVYGGATYGNIYGGGMGNTTNSAAGQIKGNTNVNINNGTILHNIYGGGAYGSVGTFTYDATSEMPTALATENTGVCNVTITGGTIGTDGHENGMVFGSSRGDVAKPDGTPAVDPNDKLAWVYDANVIIGTSGATTGPQINGSVYGSGENGHTYRNTDVKIYSGTIGINSSDNVTIYDLLDNTKKVYEGKACNYPNRGNVYGGGCGTDMYDSDSDGTDDMYNPLAGVVQGTSSVTITGGTVVHNIYGAGALGSVGKTTKDANNDIVISSGGTTTIEISGGIVGVDGDGNGNVFGAARGDSISTQAGIALVKTTNVTISGGAQIKGNVYGGGQAGDVGTYHTVTEEGLNKGNNYYLGGDASGVCNVVVTGGTIGTATNTTAGHVFGAGKGAANTYTCQKAMVKETSVTISNGTIYGDVYGGGEVGRVEQDATVSIGTGTGSGTFAPTIHGNVFGAGAGLETHGYSALVRGNSNVTIGGSAAVRKNVYGGGKAATVGKYWVSHFSPDPNEVPPTGFPDGMPYKTRDGGFCRVTIQGQATIGPASGDASEEAGQVFGAGKGVNPRSYTFTGTDKPSRMNEGGMEPLNTKGDYFQFLETLALASNTVVTVNGATVKGSVFGGSESGFVQDHTTVTVNSGIIGTSTTSTYGNVFGGGKGLETFAEAGRVRGNTTVAFNSGRAYGSVYGGGKLGDVGTIDKTDIKNYKWIDRNGNYNNTGVCSVTISGGNVGPDNNSNTEKGNVFGAGKGVGDSFWCEKAMAYDTNVSIENGTVNGNVYGGGEVGRVENDTEVTVGRKTGEAAGAGTGTPVIKGSVFGAGKGLETHGYSALVRGNTTVTVEGGEDAIVENSVYGGGEIASVGRYGLDANEMPEVLVFGGTCIVNIQGSATIGSTTGNVFGAGKGVVPHFNNTGSDKTLMSRRMTLYTNGSDFPANAPTPKGSTWEYIRNYSSEEISNNAITKYVWEYFQDEDKYKTYLETLALATHPEVTISGGATVNGSVFGGGELGITKGSVVVNIQGGTITEDVYGGGSLANTNTTKDVAKRDGNGKPLPPDSNGKYDTEEVHPTTTVNLQGGTMRHAYGGGLGRVANTTNNITPIEAKVYGDVTVKLNEGKTTADTGAKVDRVFGANNLNGSPQKDVTVYVYATQKKGKTNIGDKNGKHDPFDLEADGAPTTTYDVLAVYGGGNEAAYVPVYNQTTGATDYKTQVLIEGCQETSIKTVYGGGNAASVPESNVTIKSAYEIERVFGGGNGKDATSYGENPGADIGVYKNASNEDVRYGTGNANTDAQGGYIHELYGASNEKGTIKGNINLKTEEKTINGCPLQFDRIYNAGKNADVEGDMIAVLGCQPDKKIPEYYGGAENANVKGNVELTITSGTFGQIFAGNNKGGAIFGHIKLNIEETGCSPIIIDELYGCGNNAAYSVYGYYHASEDNDNQAYSDETHATPLYKKQNATDHLYYLYWDNKYERPFFRPRTSADDTHAAVSFNGLPHTAINPDTKQYENPEINIISVTRIGKVFGGGLGSGAVVYGNPTVNINQIYGTPNGTTATALGRIGVDANGSSADCGVFGGGNAADVIGNTTVNIGTATAVRLHESWTAAAGYKMSDDEKTVLGANILSNLYGGGNLANVTGNTFVNVCAVKSGDSYAAVAEGAAKVNIAGNVYGGGKGLADNFLCDKAMIGTDGAGVNADFSDNTNYKDGNTSVIIGNGTVGTLDANNKLVEGTGNVYGGGEIGRVEKNTVVTIGIGNGDDNKTSAPIVRGDVFGGGKGDKEHGYAALVRGNPTVIVQGDAKVGHSVYGAGEIASVARYRVPRTPKEVADAIAAGYTDAVLDMPYALANPTSGYCTVKVQGNAEIGPDNMKMVHPEITDGTDKPDDAGHVFAAGKGFLPENYPYDTEEDGHMPKRMINENGVDKWQWFHSKADYVKFIQTLALSSNTEVTIEGNAFVKGSVYGGSENGLVQYDTKVYIKGGQIGNGDGVNRRYTDAEWAYDGSNDTKSLAECASWPYEAPYAPYDPNANATGDLDKYSSGKSTEGGRRLASDGHTYYGNVFGGGSGSVPYFDTDEGISKYLNSAGTVKGNTHVEISGGHILTSVYGGCEATNVLDTAYVTMTGGTVGVPRTLNQINNHPVTCYVFGGGKGDQRIFFNKDTNVGNAVVDIQDGRIYGSVFGGGEDGHVMRNVALTIGNDDGTGPTIGTWGTTYVDGNVFGGGRGFGGEALTAGNIGGSVTMNIKGGTMLGSIYGGGRLGSVGYGLYLVDEVVGEEKPYGVLRPDGVDDNGNPVEGFKRGYITINISGGTIGNEHEYKYYAPDVELTSDMKTAANIPNTTFDYQNHLLYTKGGNVFTGCMGRLYALDGSLLPLWPKLGKCKETVLNITGGTIKSSVYGGGEIGAVQQKTTVNVTGGTVGTKVVDSEDETKYYYFGSVFGGGKGSTDAISYPAGTAEADKVDISEAGTVGGNVLVELNKGVAEDKPGGIVNQVFGCNDMNGSPKGMVDVHIYATQTVGKSNISTKLGKELGKYDVQAVYGGGNLAAYNPTDLTAGKAKVTIDGCGLSSIKQVYGGGNAASTPATEVTVNGTYEIEELFGGGNGADKLPSGSDNPGANVGFRAYLDNVEGKSDTPENRAANYGYGSGKAAVNVFGGTIHRVFGGSNTKGNVRKTAITMLEDKSECPFCVDEAYGGGKSAPMDAEAKLLMACIPGLKAVYGGAQAADVYDDVTLTITNGNFDRVFGGNNISGTIRGRIQVNIEETGCKPVIIGELYGGGNQAGYSVYGYNADGSLITSGDTPFYADPEVNVKSFTSIGNIYGGGYGTTATMVGNPIVNINEGEDATTDAQKHATAEYAGETITLEANTENEHQVTLPKHTKGKMGAINNVFGGGNAAEVIGNTNVNIGTQTEGYMTVSDTDITVGTTDVSNFYTRTGTTTATYVYTQASGTAKDGVTYYKKYNVKGADIRGNVYGGGNNAQVTGNTNVIIGKQAE